MKGGQTFNLKQCTEILQNTPLAIKGLLINTSDFWQTTNEGADSWNPIQIVQHLILAEKTNWMSRINLILSDSDDKCYKPFEREDKSVKASDMSTLLHEFEVIRLRNIEELKLKQISKYDLEKTGIHPEFGEVTLAQQLSTWCVHDLSHISQICRVMAFQYREEIGPWKQYLRIVKPVDNEV